MLWPEDAKRRAALVALSGRDTLVPLRLVQARLIGFPGVGFRVQSRPERRLCAAAVGAGHAGAPAPRPGAASPFHSGVVFSRWTCHRAVLWLACGAPATHQGPPYLLKCMWARILASAILLVLLLRL